MRKFLKSKRFIISTLCIITATIGTALLIRNSLISNKTMDANNIAKKVVGTDNTDKKQLYGTFEIETSWVKDPSEPKNLLQVTKDNAIIKVKVKSIGNAVFFDKVNGFNDPNPYTPVEVIIEKILDGQILDNINTVYLRGGEVKISDLMKTLDQATIQKMGFDTLTKEQQETMHVSYKSEHDYNLKPNEEYVLIVAKNSNNVYTIVGNGYGVFKEDKESTNSKSISSEIILKNALTKKDLTDRNGTVLKLKR